VYLPAKIDRMIWFVYAMLLAGIGFSIYRVVMIRLRVKRYSKAAGTVVDNQETKTNSGGFGAAAYSYAPVVQFTTENNLDYTLIYTEENPERPLYKIGEPVDVRYDPGEPRRFIIYDPKAEYLVAATWLIILIAGLVMTVVYG
jgi:Protein of unknown function (DUF3592)